MDFIPKAIRNPGDVWNRKTLHGAGWERQRLGQWSFTAIHSTCPHVQWSQRGHRNALNQACLPNTMGTGIFGRPDSASFHPSPILTYQRLTQEQDLGKSWGQLQHSYGWYRLPDVTVNRAQVSALMAKDSRSLTMHLVLGTLSQSLHGNTEGTNFMWEHWRSLQLREMPRYLHRNFSSFVFS